MSELTRRLGLGMLALFWGTWPADALAQPCGRADVRDTVPPDGATAVPTNATLSALYVRSADYANEEVMLEHVGVDARIPVADFNAAEGILSITPDNLEPGDDFIVTWPRLKGIGSATLGVGAEARFTVGDGPDTERPVFAGLVDVEWDLRRQEDECTDAVEERFVFDLSLGEATDDGGAESLTLVIFQTSGPTVGSGAPEPVYVGRLPEDDEPVRITRTIGDGAGRICFAALVRDLTNEISLGADEETCVRTVKPPFFESCVVAAPSGSRSGGGGAFLSLLVAFAVGARRRQSRRPADGVV